MLVYLSFLLVLLGSAILLLNLVGLWRRPGKGWDSWRRELPAIGEVGPQVYGVHACLELQKRFQPGAGHYGPASNWVAWLASAVRPSCSEIQLTDQLFRFSTCGLCSQIAQALLDTAQRAGAPGRIVSLGGHVVVELQIEGSWYGFDPDYGVVYQLEGVLVSVATAAEDQMLAGRIYESHRMPQSSDNVLRILASDQRHYFPPGQPMSPRLAHAQRWMQGFKWALPLFAILLGGVILLTKL